MMILTNLHEQERDVAKYWNDNSSTGVNVRIAFLGLENQSKPGIHKQNKQHYQKPLKQRLFAFCL